MLGTIKLPHNMKLIQGNLPESNYDSDKESKKDETPAYKAKKLLNSDDPLDEIAEVNEIDVPASVQPSGRKRNYRKPKV